MSLVLIVAEQQPDGALRKATLQRHRRRPAARARRPAGSCTWSSWARTRQVAEELKGVGAKVVHAGQRPALEHYLAEAFAPAVAELAQSLKADFVGARLHRAWART